MEQPQESSLGFVCRLPGYFSFQESVFSHHLFDLQLNYIQDQILIIHQIVWNMTNTLLKSNCIECSFVSLALFWEFFFGC